MDLGLNNININGNIDVNPSTRINSQTDDPTSGISVFYFILCSLGSRLHAAETNLKDKEQDSEMRQEIEMVLDKIKDDLQKKVDLLNWLKSVCKNEDIEFTNWINGMGEKITEAKHELDKAIKDCKDTLKKLKKKETKGGFWGFIKSKVLGIRIKINKKIKDLQKKLDELLAKPTYSSKDLSDISDTAQQLVDEIKKAISGFWAMKVMNFFETVAIKYVAKFMKNHTDPTDTGKKIEEWTARVIVYGCVIALGACAGIGGAIADILAVIVTSESISNAVLRPDVLSAIELDVSKACSETQLINGSVQSDIERDQQTMNLITRLQQKNEADYNSALEDGKIFGDLLKRQTQEV